MEDNFLSPSTQRNNQRIARYKRILRMELEASGRSQKSIAAGMDLDQGHLSRVLSPTHQDCLSVQHLEGWDREVGHGLIDYILEQRETLSTGHGASAAVLTQLMARQHGKAISDLIPTLMDGVITAEEAKFLQPTLHRYLHTVTELVRQVDGVVA